MNYLYDHSSEVLEDLEFIDTASDEDFEERFKIDREEKNQFIEDIKSDLDELLEREEREEREAAPAFDNWKEGYAYPGWAW